MSKDLDNTINFTDCDQQSVIHNLFYAQVKKHPHATALLFNDEQVSYYDFNCASNQLANYLLKQFDQRNNCIIGVLLDRSIEMFVSLFAILKVGCAYLPLNPDEPTERLEFMIKDSGIFTLITHTKFKDRIDFPNNIIFVNEDSWKCESVENPDIEYNQTDLAYMIYTSGTTGYPKGVMIEHKALLNRILWMQKQYPIAIGDIILHKTPYTFDVSVWELFWWSITGAGVSILNAGEHKDVIAIVKNIAKNKVTVMHFVPPMLSVFLDYIGTNTAVLLKDIAYLRYVFCSGEALKVHQVNRFNKLIYKENNTRLINLYGPTEAAIDVTYFDCSSESPVERVPIGKAIDNIEIYILDENNQICDTGQSGELCIVGVGLARGYLNRPELNAQKFVQLPWEPSKRMYRTGDLALILEDGNVEFLGRIDNQVKIKGNRIELGEIESALVKYEAVKEAVVIAADGKNDDRFLCAFIVPSEHFINIADIKHRLEKKLPDYMIPHQIITIQEIPLSINGKVNRKKLLDMLDSQDCVLQMGDASTDDSDWVRLINIIKSKVNLSIPADKITYENSLGEIGIDSLSFLRIVIDIEGEFGFEFDMENLNALDFSTMGCVINYIKQNIKNKVDS